MRRLMPLLCWSALACYGTDGTTSVPSSTPADTLRIVNGPLVLDGVVKSDFQIAGPGVLDITEAAFETRDGARLRIPAMVELRRFTGDSGVVLQATLVATGPIREGEYDLVLAAPGSPARDTMRIVSRALRVLRGWRPSGGTPPPGTEPAPPGGPGPTPPPPTAPPTTLTYGTLRVLLDATGVDLPAEFTVRASGGSSYVDDEALRAFSGASAEWLVSTGAYQVALANLPNNCAATKPSPVTAVVARDSTTTVTLKVTCVPAAYLRVNVTFSGVPPEGAFFAYCSLTPCGPFPPMYASGSTTLQPVAAPQDLVLNVPFNCAASIASPVAVSPVSGQTVDVNVALTCVPPNGTLRVLVRAPAGTGPYLVAVGTAGCYPWDDCVAVASVSAGQTADIPLTLGRYDAAIVGGVGPNCTITSPNPASVDVPGGGSALVTFEVTCP